VTAAEPAVSGINLARPSDSGINLQTAPGLELGRADSVELKPLSGEAIATPPPPAARPKPALAETPPPMLAKEEKDIFDDTDFEVDALDSGGDSDDKTVQLEAVSDFELEESDTGSEVFAIDEEEVDQNAATAMGPAVVEDDGEDEDQFVASSSGEVAAGAWDVESERTSAPERASASPLLAAAGASAEWGGLWVGVLGVTAFFMLLLTFVSLDLIRNLYSFQQNDPGFSLVRGIAGLFGG
jgi:hypothetical protein